MQLCRTGGARVRRVQVRVLCWSGWLFMLTFMCLRFSTYSRAAAEAARPGEGCACGAEAQHNRMRIAAYRRTLNVIYMGDARQRRLLLHTIVGVVVV